MGLPEILTQLTCSICCNIEAKNNRQTHLVCNECGNFLCDNCLRKSMDDRNGRRGKCPFCRNNLSKTSWHNVNVIREAQIGLKGNQKSFFFC